MDLQCPQNASILLGILPRKLYFDLFQVGVDRMCIYLHNLLDENILRHKGMIRCRPHNQYIHCALPIQFHHQQCDLLQLDNNVHMGSFRSGYSVPTEVQLLLSDNCHLHFQQSSRGNSREERCFLFDKRLHSHCNRHIFWCLWPSRISCFSLLSWVFNNESHKVSPHSGTSHHWVNHNVCN